MPPTKILRSTCWRRYCVSPVKRPCLASPLSFSRKRLISGITTGACVVDDRVEKRLLTLSGSLRLCFVVGLVRNDAPRYSEAVLIDGEARRVLSHKSSCDGSPCYEPFAQTPEDIILPYRGLHIGALVCMDAAAGDDGASLERQRARHAPLVEEFGRCIGTKLLCVARPLRQFSSGCGCEKLEQTCFDRHRKLRISPNAERCPL